MLTVLLVGQCARQAAEVDSVLHSPQKGVKKDQAGRIVIQLSLLYAVLLCRKSALNIRSLDFSVLIYALPIYNTVK